MVLTLARSPFTLLTRVLKLVLGPVTLLLTLPNWVIPLVTGLNVTPTPLFMAPALLSGGLRRRTLMAKFGARSVLLPSMALSLVTTPSRADPFTLPGFMMLTPVLGRKSRAMLLRTMWLLQDPWVPTTRNMNLVTQALHFAPLP